MGYRAVLQNSDVYAPYFFSFFSHLHITIPKFDLFYALLYHTHFQQRKPPTMLYKTKLIIKSEKRAIAAYLRNHRQYYKSKNIKHTLTVKNFYPMFEEVKNQCPILLGVPIDLTKKAPHDSALSLIRIDTDKGFTPDNIIICSYKAREIRGNSHFNNFYSVYVAISNAKYVLLRAEEKRIKSARFSE